MDSVSPDKFSADETERGDATAPTTKARKRDSLFLMAQLRFAGDGTVHDVRVRNLSAGGLMAEFSRIVAADTAVTLTVRGIGEVTGQVAWCAEGRVGIAFDTPIDPRQARKPVGVRPKSDYVKLLTR